MKKGDMDMTKGAILPQILIFALPLILGQLFQQLYNTFDTWCVGNFVGKNSFSAVGTVGSITNMLIGFAGGFSTGAGVVISQYYGAGDKEKVRKSVHTSILYSHVSIPSLQIGSSVPYVQVGSCDTLTCPTLLCSKHCLTS